MHIILAPEPVERWLALWDAAVEARWAGPVAERAQAHAIRMAAVIARELDGCPWSRPAEPAIGAGRR